MCAVDSRTATPSWPWEATRAVRGTPDAEVLSYLVEGAGLLESTQAVDDGAEEPE
ncbi:MAG: hypothetical protein WCI09_03230 [Planctomycetota bacterium]